MFLLLFVKCHKRKLVNEGAIYSSAPQTNVWMIDNNETQDLDQLDCFLFFLIIGVL